MPIAMACYVIMKVCEGLDYAHNKRDGQGRELDLVHRDISPQNVLISYEGEVKVIDFGIAKAAGKASKTQAGVLKGKFGYMSPEQVRGLPLDRRSDIFAIGTCSTSCSPASACSWARATSRRSRRSATSRSCRRRPTTRRSREELESIILKALAKRRRRSLPERDRDARRPAGVPLLRRRVLLAQGSRGVDEEDVRRSRSRKRTRSWSSFSRWRRRSSPAPTSPDAPPSRACPARRPAWGRAPSPRSRSSRGLRPAGKSDLKSDMNWDDEELDTQIYDKDSEPKLLRGRPAVLRGR